MSTSSDERVVVLSPHLDDAVLSLGATMTELTRSGKHVSVVTVFAGDPASTREAGPWDSRAGFRTEGEAARVRRGEDDVACRTLGVEPVWLSLPDEDYAGVRDAEHVWTALSAVIRNEDTVLVPGSPLTHNDHRWLAELFVAKGPCWKRLGLYREQPYRYWTRPSHRHSDLALSTVSSELNWRGNAIATARKVGRKWRAVCAYPSQLPLLGLKRRGLARMLAHEIATGGEMIAWVAELGLEGR